MNHKKETGKTNVMLERFAEFLFYLVIGWRENEKFKRRLSFVLYQTRKQLGLTSSDHRETLSRKAEVL